MRLAVVLHYFPWLSTTFITDQIIGLLKLGHDVEIFAYQPPQSGPVHPQVVEHHLLERTHYWFRGKYTILDAVKNTARLIRRDPWSTTRSLLLSANPRYGISAFRGDLWALSSTALLQKPFDAILCHFGENGIKAQRLREIGAFRAPLATVFHGYDLSRFLHVKGSQIYAPLFRSGNLMLPVSDYWASKLVALGCPPEKIQVQRMGIDCERFAFRPRQLQAGTVPRILSVCRLVEKKGIEYALKALARLRIAGQPFEYHVVGDGPEMSRLRALSHDLGMDELVHFHGACPHDEVVRIQERCHIFLQPSVTAQDGDQEGIPVSIMEAMACGMPVISTIHSGIPELIHDGKSGYLAPERDVAALAQKLTVVLSTPDRWPEYGKHGRNTVEQLHNRDSLNSLLARRLEEMVERAGRRNRRDT